MKAQIIVKQTPKRTANAPLLARIESLPQLDSPPTRAQCAEANAGVDFRRRPSEI
jgi:hypothetical protein